MPRVAVGDVQNILSTNLTNAQITAFILTADTIINATCATSTSPALSSDELFQIELWLSAHFACIRDPVSLREKIGDAESWNFPMSVTTAWGKGFNLTPYGQMAIAIDRTGLLASMGRMKGTFRSAPREDSDHFTPRLDKTGNNTNI